MRHACLTCDPANDQVFALGAERGTDAAPAGSDETCIERHYGCVPSTRRVMLPITCAICSRTSRLLFSGDHVLDGVTPVILPPDGDMAAYIESLQRLKAYGPRAIAPGHGGVLTEPHRIIDGVIAHRGRARGQGARRAECAGAGHAG